MYRDYSKISGIRFSEQLQAFEVDIHPVFSPYQPTAKEAESSPLPFPLGHRCVALDLLRDVRSRFPNLTVVFRDGNVDEDIFIKTDISSPSLQNRIRRVEGPQLFGHNRGAGKRVTYLIAEMGGFDLLGLAEGFVNQCAPAIFFYCANAEETSSEGLIRALEDSSDETSLVRELVKCCDLLLSTGPDAYYFTIQSKEESFLKEMIGSSK